MIAGRQGVGTQFSNWARNQSCVPTSRAQPASVAEVADLVTQAHRSDRRVKAVGAGHSFTAAACTDGLLLNLDRLSAITAVDRDANRVTFGAGIRLADLSRELDQLGLALPNLGDIDTQSFAGATATATHGTGAELGNLATTIVGMEVVTGTGEILRINEQENAELLRVASVGLGALGIVTEVTIEAVPAFNLEVFEEKARLGDVLDSWEDFVADNDHAEFFWMPGSSACLTKRNNRTAAAATPPSKAAYFMDKIVAENVAFGLSCRAIRRWPSLGPKVASAISKGLSDRHFVDRSHRVFASPRHVRFVEMEYGLPRAAVPEALERVRALIATLAKPPLFPVEVRVSAPDDIALSTGHGRENGWIAVHEYQGMPYEPYFRGVEAIMDDYDGRPHWGKMHFQTAATLAPRFPEWDKFAAARARLDPTGAFRNGYLDRVLGRLSA